MVGGLASNVLYAGNLININVAYPTGTQVLYTTTSGSALTNLTTGTTYFVINAGSFQLAATSTGALAGVSINLVKLAFDNNDAGTITPLAFVAGSCGLVWQGSNDGTNWFNLTASSVTFSGAGTTAPLSQGWDIGYFDYKYLQAVWTAGTSGIVDLILHYFGKYN